MEAIEAHKCFGTLKCTCTNFDVGAEGLYKAAKFSAAIDQDSGQYMF